MKFFNNFLLMSMALFAFSCSDLTDFEPVKPTVYAEYISLPDGADIDNLNLEDYEIVLSAFPRFNFHEDRNGLFSTDIITAEQINVSEEVFSIMMDIIANTNEMLLQSCGNERNSSLTRSVNIETDPSDCLARSIAIATGEKYEKVNSYIESEYGTDGVPITDVAAAINHFGSAESHQTDFYVMNEAMLPKSIVIFAIGNGYHAVNGFYVAKYGEFVCLDYQAGPEPKMIWVEPWQISHIFNY